MAISNKNLVLNNNFLIPLLAFATMFFMLPSKVKSANSVSFNFNRFGPDQKDLIFQGDATSSKNVLQLTRIDIEGRPMSGSVGRVLYSAPLHLWKNSRVLSSFETTFTFSISSASITPADGLTFFIASHDSSIPPNSNGRLLGLFSDTNALKNSSSSSNIHFKAVAGSNNVVAVEFDTYPNTDIGDPDYKHIGIDVNSIRSKATAKWNWQSGEIATAHITYNSASKRFSVVTSYPGAETLTLSYDIDLNTILPPWVRVGFSAATGENSQINTIHSWSFTSTLKNKMVVGKEQDMYITTVV